VYFLRNVNLFLAGPGLADLGIAAMKTLMPRHLTLREALAGRRFGRPELRIELEAGEASDAPELIAQFVGVLVLA
jgi:hypothetical protein